MTTVRTLSLSPADRRSDARGFLQLIVHLAALGLTGTGLVRWWSTPWTAPLAVVHGFVLIFLFCAEHECIHRTAFRSRRINDVVAAAIGVLLLLPSRWFRLFHAAHHRYTQDPLLDPELDGWKPPARSGIVLQMTGLLYWKAMAKIVWSAARGRTEASWLPPGHVRKVVRQARIMVVVYAAMVAGSVVTGSWLLLQLWIVPVLVGQPFLRWYLLAEHTGCPIGEGIVAGTRTTLTNPVMRFFAWNMPFHREHHAHPQVPFHALPATHREWAVLETATEGVLSRGYLRTVAQLQRDRWRDAPR
jgi:fatty acid desaturase